MSPLDALLGEIVELEMQHHHIGVGKEKTLDTKSFQS